MPLPWTRPARPDTPAYFGLASGLVGAGGTRFRTTEALLHDYAAPVLDRVGLGTLVAQAEVWVRSPTGAGILALALALTVLPWWAGALAGLAAAALWTLAVPGLATPRVVPVLRVLDHPLVQAGAYVVVLSLFAAQGRFAEVWTGMAGFVAMRLGLVRILLEPAVAPALARLYALPFADQVLRSLILRTALRRGILLPGMAEMEARARAFWRRSRR
jgi:hypothetical protein